MCDISFYVCLCLFGLKYLNILPDTQAQSYIAVKL